MITKKWINFSRLKNASDKNAGTFSTFTSMFFT